MEHTDESNPIDSSQKSIAPQNGNQNDQNPIKKKSSKKKSKQKSEEEIDATLFTIKYPALEILPSVGTGTPNECFRSISIV